MEQCSTFIKTKAIFMIYSISPSFHNNGKPLVTILIE